MEILQNPDFRYSLLRKIAGSGTVWVAYDCLDHKEVVLKLQATARNQSEASVLLLLSSVPGVAKLIASLSQLEIVTNGSAIVSDALILEYYPLGDLLDLVQGPRYDPNDERVVRTIFIEIATALLEVHKRNIAHLDIKPENVLFDCSGHALLADFDLAVTGNLEQITRHCGTPGYKAPEVGLEAYDGKAADVFSLGVTLFAMRLKHMPFSSVSDMITLREHSERYWLNANRHKAKVSAGFCRLFARMVNINPLHRPTITEVLADPWLADPQVAPEYIQHLLTH
jgi:serine/threonine protein kinase